MQTFCEKKPKRLSRLECFIYPIVGHRLKNTPIRGYLCAYSQVLHALMGDISQVYQHD